MFGAGRHAGISSQSINSAIYSRGGIQSTGYMQALGWPRARMRPPRVGLCGIVQRRAHFAQSSMPSILRRCLVVRCRLEGGLAGPPAPACSAWAARRACRRVKRRPGGLPPSVVVPQAGDGWGLLRLGLALRCAGPAPLLGCGSASLMSRSARHSGQENAGAPLGPGAPQLLLCCCSQAQRQEACTTWLHGSSLPACRQQGGRAYRR